MATPVEQIKERLSIVEVVSSYVQLHKAGRHYKGKSPFTNEKTPSFFVSPDRGMYYCFSSGKGGDMFTFIEEMEGVDFKGALAILAERAQVELVREDPKKRSERDTLYALLEEATVYFAQGLARTPRIGEYLAKRAVRPETIAKWRIGYVPEGWRNLRDHLASRGYTDAMMLRAGLIKKSEEGNSYYDVFRDRIMFPITDVSGRVVAYSGRAMSSDPALPKYVNSPETELYEKSRILFGYDKAKQSIRTHDFSLIVEGQFDLVLAHQAGFSNTVAISGTALSAEHATLLERLSRRVVLALDADRAGINSVKRSAQVLLVRGMDVKVARLADGKDPADMVAEDPALLKAAVRGAKTVVEFLIDVLRETARDERTFKLSVRDEVLPFLLQIPSPIEREHFEAVVGEALATTKDAIHFEVERLAQAAADAREREAHRADDARAPSRKPAREHAARIDELARFLYGVLHAARGTASSAIDAAELEALLVEAIGEERFNELAALDEQEHNKLAFEADAYAEQLPPATFLSDVHASLREVTERRLRNELRVARDALAAAEHAGDASAAADALARCADIQKRLALIGNGAPEH